MTANWPQSKDDGKLAAEQGKRAREGEATLRQAGEQQAGNGKTANAVARHGRRRPGKRNGAFGAQQDMPAQQRQPEGAHQHGDWRKAQQGGILLAALDDDSGDVGKRKPHQQPRPRHGQRVGVTQQRGQWRPTGGVLRGRDVAAGMAQLLPVPPDKAAVVAQQPVAPQLPPAAQRALL